MKRIMTTACLAAMIAASPALAADLPASGHQIDVPATKGTAFTGLSLYVFGGGEIYNVGAADFDGIGADGLTGGLGVTYDAVCGATTLRCGVWAEGGASSVAVTYGGHDLLRQDYFGGAGVRAGVVLGNSLVYGRAGYVLTEWSSDLTSDGIGTRSWLLGGGIETQIGPRWSVGASMDYLLLDEANVGGHNVTAAIDEAEALRATLRVIYRPDR